MGGKIVISNWGRRESLGQILFQIYNHELANGTKFGERLQVNVILRARALIRLIVISSSIDFDRLDRSTVTM